MALLLISCHNRKEELSSKKKQTALPPIAQSLPPLVNPLGDTIPTGVPILTNGTWIDPSQVARPKKVFTDGQFTVVPAYPNVHPVGKPRVFNLPGELSTITPGENGVSRPKTVTVQGKRVPAIQTGPVPALSLRIKDDAIADIRYLDAEQGMSSFYIIALAKDKQGNLWFGTRSEGVSRYDGKHFLHFTEQEGLSNNSIYAILVDRRGYLWFATNKGGVTCYDGDNFTHFTETEGMISNTVYSLLEDRQGNLWFGTAGGVSRYDGKKFTHFTEKEGLVHDPVHAMLEDSQGNLWFGTTGGVSQYDGKRFTRFADKEGLGNTRVTAMVEDRQGNIWFGTRDGLVRYDGSHFSYFTEQEGLSSKSIYSTYLDSRGDLWFGTLGGGVNRYDGRNFTHFTEKEGLSHNSVFSILEDDRGNMWFATLGGVSRYNGESFSFFSQKEGLSQTRVLSMLEDNRGYLWFGTYEGTVCRYDGSHFTQFTGKLSFDLQNVNSILQDRRGNIWFSTLDRGVSCYDGKSITHFTEKEGLLANRVESMVADSSGNVWFGTALGASRYNGESFTQFTPREGLPHASAIPLFTDSKGRVWFRMGAWRSRYEGRKLSPQATLNPLFSSALSCFDGQRFIYFTVNEGLRSNMVLSTLEDTEGTLWFGTLGGLSHFTGEGVTHFPGEDTSWQAIDPLFKTTRGEIWFGANDGTVGYYQNGRIGRYPLKRDLKNNFVYSFTEDANHNVWISTDRGVGIVTSKDKNADAAIGSSPASTSLITLHKDDGLKHIDLGGTMLDRENHLWWSGLHGLTRLDLDQFKLPQQPPINTQLTHIEIEQQFIDFRRLSDTAYTNRISFGKALSRAVDSVALFNNYPINLSLPYTLNHLTFYFSAIDWSGPHKIRYRYIMEGLDKTWSIPSPEPKADYRNLPAGTYTLKVAAMGAAQIWSEPFAYTFTILPPWWRSWWAYVIYGLVITGLLYSFNRLFLNRKLHITEKHRLQELDQFKVKLYSNITHEFRTPLTIILGMIDKMAARANTGEWLEEGIEMIRRNSQTLLHLVNQMLDLTKLESGKMTLQVVHGDIIPYLRFVLESFQSYAETKHISLSFETEEEHLMLDYDPDSMLQIVSNLLSNAIKFTLPGGRITLKVDTNPLLSPQRQEEPPSYYQITVSDTGIGIAEEKLPYIFDRFYQVSTPGTSRGSAGVGIGLALTWELVKLQEGEITVTSQVGEGTEFRVVLPIRQQTRLTANREGSGSIPFEKSAPLTRLPALDKPLYGEANEAEKPSVLIVEDNPDVILYLRSCLEEDYFLEVAHDGQEGIDKALMSVPDLIISDVMMPLKDGFELCETLKSDERSSHIPIILLTARADLDSRLEGLKKGAEGYLVKPFAPPELLARVQNLLELRKSLQLHYLDLAASNPLPPPPIVQAEENAFVLKIRHIIESHLSDVDFGVDQLSREAGMSYSNLHRKVSALTGYSVNQYIRFVRLSAASAMLRNPEATVATVAYACGFTDAGYFARVFRTEFGESPSAWRKRVLH